MLLDERNTPAHSQPCAQRSGSNAARRNLTLRTFKENGDIVFSVKDQGKGIEPKVLEKIGTPFFTTKDNGTGLGLALCYSIATRHNAKIEIDTNDRGTTFFVKFKQET